MISAIASKGYSYYVVDFRLHRATVIFPVFFSLLLAIYNKAGDFKIIPVESKSKRILIFLFLFIFITGILYQKNFLDNKEISRHLVFSEWLLDKLTTNSTLAQNVYLDPGINSESSIYISLADVVEYIKPQLEITVLPEDCANLNERDNREENYVVFGEKEKSRCLSKILEEQRWVLVN